MATIPTSIPFETEHPYNFSERNGVIALVVAAMMSLTAVLLALSLVLPRMQAYKRTHILGYFICLLASNAVQSTGTVMNIRWVTHGGVFAGGFCSAQGGIKQAGNVGNALWSFIIAVHLFNLLFLRYPSTIKGFAATLIIGWGLIIMIVVIGPTAIQSTDKGPYFGISGSWCWITDDYPKEQTFLEYFFEYISAAVCFVLYTAILLRVRGNLFFIDGQPRMRFVPRGQSWQLSLGRDFMDSSVLRVVQRMIWHPIAYCVLIVPIGLARLSEFGGHHVPDWAITVTAVIFNLTGLVNVILFLTAHRLFPDSQSLPGFSSTRRKTTHMSMFARYGVTPFTLSSSFTETETRGTRLGESSEVPPVPALPVKASKLMRRPKTLVLVDEQIPHCVPVSTGSALPSRPSSCASVSSLDSVTSQTPLHPYRRSRSATSSSYFTFSGIRKQRG